MKTKSGLSVRWFVGLTMFTLVSVLTSGVRAQTTYSCVSTNGNINFSFSQPIYWSGPNYNPPQYGAAGDQLTFSKSGTQVVTNDYGGHFVLTILDKGVGIWTVTNNPATGGSVEFTNDASGNPPWIYDTQGATANKFNLSLPIQLDAVTSITNNANNETMFLYGPISGLGGILIPEAGTNMVSINGPLANTYTGGTTIQGGVLALEKPANVVAIPGNVTIGNGTATAVLYAESTNQFAPTSILTFGGNGIFRMNGNPQTVGGLASTGGYGLIENSNATSRTLTLQVTNSDQTFSGIIQNGAGAGNLAITKTGPNAQILTGVNTYTGGTVVSAGALTLSGSGSINNSAGVTVVSNATFNVLSSGYTVSYRLTGAGTIAGGPVTVASGGILNPGDNQTATTMTISGNLILSSGATNNYYFSPVTNCLINAGGLTLNGGVFNLYQTNSTTTFTTPSTYNLIQYAGSIGGAGLDSTWTTVSGSNPHIGNPQPGLAYSFQAAGGYLQVVIGYSSSTINWNVNGGGSWNSAANWSPNTVPDAAGATANMGTVATTFANVTLDAAQTVGVLSFGNANSYEIDSGSGGSLTLNNSGSPAQVSATAGTGNTVTAAISLTAGVVVNAASSTSVALNGPISGAGGLTNNSSGTLVLGGNDSYTVGTVQNSGTLALNSAGALGTAPLAINGGILDNTSGTNVTLAGNPAQTWSAGFFFAGTTNLNLGSGAVTITPASETVNVVSNTLEVDGVIAGANNLSKTGNGTLTLGGANTYSGTTTVGAGILNLTGVNAITNTVAVNGTATVELNNAAGALPAGITVDVNAYGAGLDVAQSDTIGSLNILGNAYGAGTLTVTNLIAANIAINETNVITCSLAGAAQVKKTGQGMTILGAANSYTGGTLVDGASSYLKLTNSGTLGSTSGQLDVDTSSAIVDLGGTSQTVGPVLIGGIITNGTLTGTSYAVTNGVIYATLAGSGVALTKSQTNTAILAGANTYTGPTTISAGTLQVDGSTASGSTVALNGGILSGTGTVGGSVTEAAGAILAPGDNNVGTLTLGANFSLSNAGFLSFAATNTSSYSRLNVQGNLNAAGVTTIILPNTALPDGTYNLIGCYGTLNAGPANFSVTSVSPDVYTIVTNLTTSPKTVQLIVSTPVLLTWMGDGFNNEWNTTDTGDWGNPPPATATYADGDSVLFNDSAYVVSTNVTLVGTLNPQAVTVNSTTNNYVFADGGSGAIGGSATLTKQGAGTLTINTANSYTGVTTVDGGILALGNSGDNALGADPATPTPGQVVLNGGTLASDGATVNANRGIALGPLLGAGSGTLDTLTSGSLEIDAVIANNGAGVGTLDAGFLGTGYVKLTATNTYTGGTVISNGIVELENDQSKANGGFIIGPHNDNVCYLQIDPGANVAVAAGNTVQVGAENTGTAGITFTSHLNDYGTVTNNGTLFAGRVSDVTIETGVGGGAGGLWVQNGNMILEAYGNLAANMTVAAGATNIYNGTNLIQLNGPGTTYAIKSTLTISGMFITGEGFTDAINQTTGNGYGQVTFGGGGYLQLTTNIASLFSTTTNEFGGVHCVINVGGGTIDTGIYTATNYQGITGNGSLTKVGSGELVMAGTNAYVGNNTVNGGTLAIQQPTLNTNSTVTITNGAVLQLDFMATNTVKSLVLNGVSQPTGVVYNSINTGGYLTGVGALLVAPGTNDMLTALDVNNAGNPLSLTPAFDGDPTQTYLATNSSGPVTVTVTSADLSAASTLFVNGNYVGSITSGVPSAALVLEGGTNNAVTVQVVSADTSMTNDYNLEVYEPLSTNAYLSALVVSNTTSALNLNPMFSANPAVSYQATNGYGAGPVTVTVVNADLTAADTLFVNGAAEVITSGIPSMTFSLGGGSNSVITVQVVSQDSSVTNNYTVAVYQQNQSLSPVDTLASLVLSNGTTAVSLTPSFGANTYTYYGTNTLPAHQVNVTVTDTNGNETNRLIINSGLPVALIPGQTSSLQSLNAGANTVTVQVVSQDQAHTNSYTVNVYDQPSLTTPKLTGSVSGGTLSLSWDANHLGYRLLVQTNNQNVGISKNANDWGTVAGSTLIASTNLTILRTNEFYRLVYP